MIKLPITRYPAVLRTDFSSDRIWRSIKKDALGDYDEDDDLTPYFIEDAAFEDLTKDEILAAVPEDYPNSFIFVVDKRAITEQGHPVSVIELKQPQGREFRAVPSAIETIFANLYLANLDFEDFLRTAGTTGVYRQSPVDPSEARARSSGDRDRLPRTDLGAGGDSLPDAATAGVVRGESEPALEERPAEGWRAPSGLGEHIMPLPQGVALGSGWRCPFGANSAVEEKREHLLLRSCPAGGGQRTGKNDAPHTAPRPKGAARAGAGGNAPGHR